MAHTSYFGDYVPIQSNTLGKISNRILNEPVDCEGIGYRIFQALKHHTDFIGQVDEETGEEISFGKMLEKSVKCAAWLEKNNISSNDIITICSHNHIDAYVPFLAALYIGAIVNPLDDITFHPEKIYTMLQKKPKIIFVDTSCLHTALSALFQLQNCNTQVIHLCRNPSDVLFPTLEDIIDECNELDNYVANFYCAKFANVKITQTAAMLFSPGTFDTPRIVEVSQGAFLAPARQQAPHMRTGDVGLWFESLAFSTGMFLTFYAILLRVKVIKVKSTFKAEKAVEIINRHNVTWMFLETSLCMQIIKCAEFKQCVSLKTIVYGGSTDYRKLFGTFLANLLPNTSIIEIYNTTAIGVIVYQQIKRHEFITRFGKDIQMKISSLGSRKDMPAYNFGEIVYKSPYLKYCTDLCATNRNELELLKPNIPWYYTGDYGFYTEQGIIYIHNRISELFTFENTTISVSQIEHYLRNHSIVNDVAAVIVPHNNIPTNIPYYHNFVLAFVVLSPSMQENKLCPRCVLRSIMTYNLPCIKYFFLTFMDTLPRLSNGKIYRNRLCRLAKTFIRREMKNFIKHKRMKAENATCLIDA